jgi:hypothetical protein
VGYATFSGASHAGLWTGTAASFVDLHAELPNGYSSSQAFDVSSDGTVVRVVGYAYNTSRGAYEAVMWSQPVPEPATVLSLSLMSALLLSSKRTRRPKRRRSDAQ